MFVEMVKLIDPFEQEARAVGERGSSRTTPRSHHNWGARFGRRREKVLNNEPKGLLELEELTRRTVKLMEKHSPISEQDFGRAMDLLRLQYNMTGSDGESRRPYKAYKEPVTMELRDYGIPVTLKNDYTSESLVTKSCVALHFTHYPEIPALLSTLSINCTPLRDSDLDVIINLLQKHVQNDKTSEESYSSSGDDNAYVGQKLKTMDVIDLIQQANKAKNKVQNDNNRQRYKNNPYAVNLLYQNRQYVPNKYDKSNGLKNLIMKQLLDEDRKPLKKTTHKHLTPNRLLSSNKYKDNGLEQIGGLNEYSKIFIILDPIALQNSRNADDLSSLVSSVLSQSSSAVDKKRQDRNKGFRYKGFMVKDGSRRFRRESKEMYGGGGGGGGGIEDEYRPKRPRSEHGGGGGGGNGGRTAIPYIRHRGDDVYERDH